jgi:hypothetical protein
VHTHDFSIPVTASNNQWNLAGNPFTCALDWSSADISKTDITGTAMYIWDQSLNGNLGGYRMHNGTVGVPSGTSAMIPAMQGFFVHSTASGSIGINVETGDPLVHGSQDFYKNEFADNLRLRVEVEGKIDEAAVLINPAATNGFDPSFDAYKLFNGHEEVPEIYTLADDSVLVVNVIGHLPAEVPVNIHSDVETEVMLTAFDFESMNPEIQILMEDRLTGNFINLRDTSAYSLDVSPGENEGRIYLHFALTTGLEEYHDPGISAWVQDGNLYLSGMEQNSKVLIHSVSGSLLRVYHLHGTEQSSVVPALPAGCYLVTVMNGYNLRTTKLFIF